MKIGHEITDRETIRKIKEFKPGAPVRVKTDFMNAGKAGTIKAVFPWGNDVAASVEWHDGARETVSIKALEKAGK